MKILITFCVFSVGTCLASRLTCAGGKYGWEGLHARYGLDCYKKHGIEHLFGQGISFGPEIGKTKEVTFRKLYCAYTCVSRAAFKNKELRCDDDDFQEKSFSSPNCAECSVKGRKVIYECTIDDTVDECEIGKCTRAKLGFDWPPARPSKSRDMMF